MGADPCLKIIFLEDVGGSQYAGKCVFGWRIIMFQESAVDGGIIIPYFRHKSQFAQMELSG